MPMHRRAAVSSMIAGSLAMAGLVRGGERTGPARSALGIVVYALGNRARVKDAAGAGLGDPIQFLEYCQRLGAGGIQFPLGVRDQAYCMELRRKAEALGMFVEGIVDLPVAPAAVETFEAQLRTAALCGAAAVRTVMIPGRRYEQYASEEEFRRLEARGIEGLGRAEPIAARQKVRLAVENHKDHRVPERLSLLRRMSSEWIGACVDTGNSFALLEDPLETVKAYAPWAVSVHLKDQRVAPYDDGFLFADAALGEGFLELAAMVDLLRKANPVVRFSLETITRDPLKVPCLTDRYWVTFGEVGGRDLARTLRTVRNRAEEDLPTIGGLSAEEQVEAEDRNVRRSLAYARDKLGLVS